MPTSHDLHDPLSRNREITISVTGRKSGRTISNPIWFVYEEGKLYLLPVQGSDTQWYKNVLANPTMTIRAGKSHAEFSAVAITEKSTVASVVEKFRQKYGSGDVKKYYSKFDVAILAKPH